jgi:hypothetical protein
MPINIVTRIAVQEYAMVLTRMQQQHQMLTLKHA